MQRRPHLNSPDIARLTQHQQQIRHKLLEIITHIIKQSEVVFRYSAACNCTHGRYKPHSGYTNHRINRTLAMHQPLLCHA